MQFPIWIFCFFFVVVVVCFVLFCFFSPLLEENRTFKTNVTVEIIYRSYSNFIISLYKLNYDSITLRFLSPILKRLLFHGEVVSSLIVVVG